MKGHQMDLNPPSLLKGEQINKGQQRRKKCHGDQVLIIKKKIVEIWKKKREGRRTREAEMKTVRKRKGEEGVKKV